MYKYNPGIVNEETEDLLDMSILRFFNLAQAPSHRFNIIPTISWCPLHLQGTSNLCSVFVFHIYYYLNMLRNMPIKDIIDNKLQEVSKIPLFLEELSKELPGTGEHEISLQ